MHSILNDNSRQASPWQFLELLQCVLLLSTQILKAHTPSSCSWDAAYTVTLLSYLELKIKEHANQARPRAVRLPN
eukprot:1099077-Pelagomonas_calceolata.AAC.3